MNLAAPKAAAKHGLLFVKTGLSLLNKHSCLAPALGVVTKLLTVRHITLVTLLLAT